MTAPAKVPEAPWVWRSFGGQLMLVTAHRGAKVVLSAVYDRNTGETAIRVRDADGRLVPITADHPVARLLQSAPQMLSALELAESALAVRGSVREERVQVALETVRQVLAIARAEAAEVAT